MKLSDDVLTVLDRCRADGPVLFLPSGQLERPLYEAVNKVLVAAGGKWSRGAKGHVFDGPAVDAIEPVLLTGEVTNRKQDFGQFDTPDGLAMRAAQLAKIRTGHRVLEPSAGTGALVRAAIAAGGIVFGYELDPKRHASLMMQNLFYPITGGPADFLMQGAVPEFDVVLMNPPFAKRADVLHVIHAQHFLKPGGRLVAIMGAGITFRSDKLTLGLRELIAQRRGTIERLPEDSFKASGTSVNTALVAFDVP